jgi:hypothetical protein
LLGLRSRWTTPRRWTAPTAEATRVIASTLSAIVSGLRVIRSKSVSPSSHSIAR